LEVRNPYWGAARWAISPGDAGARYMASDVLICSDSIALGVGLESLFRFLKEAKLNFDDSLSRDAERPGPFLEGGGGNCEVEDALVALDGITMDPGRLWKPDVGRAEDGVLVGGGGGGGGCGKPLPCSCGDELSACVVFWGCCPGE
jgi:hypothetical protein